MATHIFWSSLIWWWPWICSQSAATYFTPPSVDMKVNWEDAQTYCQSEGTTLASIHSLDDFNDAKAQCDDLVGHIEVGPNDIIGCWTGLNNVETQGEFQWSDGTPSDYGFANDDPSQPVEGVDPWSANTLLSSPPENVAIVMRTGTYYNWESDTHVEYNYRWDLMYTVWLARPMCNGRTGTTTPSDTTTTTSSSLCGSESYNSYFDYYIGDGRCDGAGGASGNFNTQSCGWDGGDCCMATNSQLTDDDECLDPQYQDTTTTTTPTTTESIRTCTKDVNYVIDGALCQVWGDPHFRTWSGQRHDFMGQPTKGNSQVYYVARCNGVSVDAMPFTIIGHHTYIGLSDIMTGLDYLTFELYDDDGTEYLLFFNSSIASYTTRYDAGSTLYASVESTVLTSIRSDTNTQIGNRFSIRFTESFDDIEAILTIDGTCFVKFWMESWTGITTLYIKPPTCYKCFICGLCGDFKREAAISHLQKLETCDGGFVNYVAGWESHDDFAHDLTGNTWGVSYCSRMRRRLSGSYGDDQYLPDVGDDFTYVEPCDSYIAQITVDLCQTARDNAVTCCDLIGSTFCDELQETCEIDACVVSGTDSSVIDTAVEKLFTAAIDLACNIPNVAELFDESRVTASTSRNTATDPTFVYIACGSMAFVLCIACILYLLCRKTSADSTKSGSVSLITEVPSSTTIAMTEHDAADVEACVLPTGWVEMHTGDGRVYYQNNSTKQTQWDKPNTAPSNSRETVNLQSSAKPAPATASTSDIVDHKPIYPVLPSRTSVDASNNTQSNDLSAQLNEEDALPSGWIQLHTKDNRIYYQNNVTKETQWTMPSHSQVTVTSKEATSTTNVVMTAVKSTTPDAIDSDVVPKDWAEMHTSDGRVYYQNNATKQTQWEKPSDANETVISTNDINTAANPIADARSNHSSVQMNEEEHGETLDVMETPGYINSDQEDDCVLNDVMYSDIKQFLEGISVLEEENQVKYFKLFILNGFDSLEIVKTISQQDLLDIGVTKLGHRKIIVLKAQQL
eukprot:879898_1